MRQGAATFAFKTAYTPCRHHIHPRRGSARYNHATNRGVGAKVAAQRDRSEAFLGKAKAELGELADAGILSAGNAFSSVLIVKAEWPIGDDGELRPPLSGEDGTALRAALGALGYAPEDWAAISIIGANGLQHEPDLIRRAIVTFDPGTVVICDDFSAGEVARAFGDELGDAGAAALAPGELTYVLGMRMLNLGGFEESLADPREKQLRWRWLKQVRALGEPF